MADDGSIDDGAVTALIARTAPELNAPFDYSALTSSTVRTADGETNLADASADTRFEYQQYLAALGDWMTLGQAVIAARAAGQTPGQPLTAARAAEWDDLLRNLIADRHGLANYSKQHYRAKVADDQQRIRDLKADVARQHDAFKNIEQAERDAHSAESLTKALLTINEAYEALESVTEGEIDPARLGIGAAGFIRGQFFGVSKLVEQGVANLGAYSVALATVSEGYASIDELKQDATQTLANLNAASDQLAFDQEQLQRAIDAENS
ncbi:MAG TPA: hypothetical protein VFF06_36450 [Polyangia bacterium]|nr:hypothetical protein [Polyangia bacterium]